MFQRSTDARFPTREGVKRWKETTSFLPKCCGESALLFLPTVSVANRFIAWYDDPNKSNASPNFKRERKNMNTTKKFDGRATDYTASRPSYALELIDYLYSNCGITKSSMIADVGSGTGKFAKHLLDKGSEVYCVEPNSDMRDVAENELCEYQNFHSVMGDAENTTLKNDSIDYITTAQAFHWFDVSKFKQECSRIIKSGGAVFLIWNVRSNSDLLNRELFQIYSTYCPNFHGFSGGIEKDDQRIKEFFNGNYDYVSFDNPLLFDRERFVTRSLSSSYSLKEGDSEYAKYIEALNKLFDKYQNNGIVSVANQSVAYFGTIK